VKRFLWRAIIAITKLALRLRDALVWPQLNLGSHLETVHNWAWTKLQNEDADDTT